MAFTVPPLPFAMDALEPYMSSKTLSYHYVIAAVEANSALAALNPSSAINIQA